MSHYPFVLQEALGVAPPPGANKKSRVAEPTEKTPATFNLNWDYSENGPTDPRPEEGVCTFMGPAITHHAGRGRKWPDDKAYCIKVAVDILRKEGYCFTAPLKFDSFGTSQEEIAKMSEQERELKYFQEQYYDDIEMKKDNDAPIVLTNNCGWLCIRCANEGVAQIIEDKLSEHHYAFGRVEHAEIQLVKDGNLTVTCVSGNKEGSTSPSPGTLFFLKRKDKVIAKALCSYHNGEMDNPGPTIELIETAAEWRGHRYGASLLEAMEEHFESVFDDVLVADRVKFNVCYVTNAEACNWFQNTGGFRDWDGMGEELGKYLGE